MEEIGAGAMGVVYRARDERLNREVALKVLPLQTDTDPTARTNLIREAQTASALNHPYICVVHEVGEEEGHIYVAMEYVRGQTLAALLLHASMRPRDVLRYGCQIAEALEHAHAMGIVHRDLKTANVVVTLEGRVKVLDFGLAKRLSTDEIEGTLSRSLLSEGQIAGTLPYMAPEVLNGSPADERVDIWALGVVLYEMCAGVRPFQGRTTYELTSTILRDDPPPLPATVPTGLAAVIDRCLSKEPSRRYQRAGEVRAALEGVQAGSIDVLPPVPSIWSRLRPWAWTTLAVLAVVLAVAVYSYVAGRGPIRSIAILPFSASSPDFEYLSDGITDSLIDSVSRLPQVKVISHTSAFVYKGKVVDPHSVGNELKVGAVLTGSVTSRDDALSVSVELVNTSDNTRLWGAQYTRKIADIITVQGDISQEIGEQLRLHLSLDQKRRLTAPSTENSEAYQLFLRGQYYMFKRTPEDYETSRRYFEQAIGKDPSYATAYAGLSNYYLQLADSGLAPLKDVIPRAKTLTHQALALDPELALGHTQLGMMAMFYDRDFPEAERKFKLAMDLSPNWVSTYRGYVIWLRAMGRPKEAIATMKHARALDPLSIATNASLGWEFYYAHQYLEAIEQFQTTLAMDPTSLSAQFGLASAFQQSGKEKEAIQAWQSYIEASGGHDFASEFAKTYATSGYGAAMDMFRHKALEFNTEAAKDGYISPMIFAGLHAAMGNKDKAFIWLAKADDERSSKLLDLEVDPDFDSLRGDPRYTELLRRIRLL